MDISTVVLASLIGILLGAVLTFFGVRRRVLALRDELAEAQQEIVDDRAALAAAEGESRILNAENQRLHAQQRADANVLQALAPVAQRVGQMHEQVSSLEKERLKQFTELTQLLRHSQDADQELLRTTSSLRTALNNDRARGTWGEVQLRRVVESAGMVRHVDFTEQVAMDGLERAGRPDLVIHLPQNKNLVVDAKAPLGAFMTASQTEMTEKTLKVHAAALKSHVDTLASKQYWEMLGDTPELVVCFVPAESILSLALDADPGLFEYALGRNVVIASPSSLLAILKSVAFTWRQDTLTEDARAIFALSQELYRALARLGDRVAKLGRTLNTSVEDYNKLVGTLEATVLSQARKLDASNPDGLPSAPTSEKLTRPLGAPEFTESA